LRLRSAESQAELGGGFAVAGEAKGAEVVEVALASTFGYRTDVVGVPEGAAAGDGLHAVEGESGETIGAAGAFEGVIDGNGIGVAEGADATVAGKDLIAKVAGVSAEAVLVDAVIGAEGAAAFGEDFKLAPAAEGEVIGAAREGLGLGAAAGEGTGEKHRVFRIGCELAEGEWWVGFWQAGGASSSLKA